jgi:AraC-like DNA-binding protein
MATQVYRHDSEVGRWELVLREPHPSLQLYVHEYVGYLESTATMVCRQELPSTRVPVIINFGPAFRVRAAADEAEWRDLASFAAGLHEEYALAGSTGASYCMQVDLTPIGAHLVFGVPMSELRNRVVALEDLLGVWGRRLTDELEDAPSWENRFALLDERIADRIATARASCDGIAWAWLELVRAGGNLSVGVLAQELGWSHRRLIARFREQVGIPPKKVARLLRFERVIETLDRSGGVGFAEAAYRCGYYDQAHLIRDFHEFAGTTPTELVRRYLSERGGIKSVQDMPAVAA